MAPNLKFLNSAHFPIFVYKSVIKLKFLILYDSEGVFCEKTVFIYDNLLARNVKIDLKTPAILKKCNFE